MRDWTGWDQITLRIRQASGLEIPLAPIDHGSYGSHGLDTVAALKSSEEYEVYVYDRSTGQLQKYQSLRSYFIGQVLDEINLTDGESAWPGAESEI